MARGRDGRGRGRGRGRGGRGGRAQGADQERRQEASPSKRKSNSQRSDGADSKNHKVAGDCDASEGKHFHRRQVTSNWHRYDEPLPTLDDEFSEEVEAERRKEEAYRLEAFEDLMGRKHGRAGFRFQAEQFSDEEFVQQEVSSATIIDCNALALSLKTIPLHNRLGLDISLLEPSTVAQFERVAEAQPAILDRVNLAATNYPSSVSETATRTVIQPDSKPHSGPPPGFSYQHRELSTTIRDSQTAVLDTLLASANSEPKDQALEMTGTLSASVVKAKHQRIGGTSPDDELDVLLATSRPPPTANTPVLGTEKSRARPPQKHASIPGPRTEDGTQAPLFTEPKTNTSSSNHDKSLPSSAQQPNRTMDKTYEHDDELDFLLGLSHSSTQPH